MTDALKYNVRSSFGRNIDNAASGNDAEILPIGKPKTRRVKARRKKAYKETDRG